MELSYLCYVDDVIFSKCSIKISPIGRKQIEVIQPVNKKQTALNIISFNLFEITYSHYILIFMKYMNLKIELKIQKMINNCSMRLILTSKSSLNIYHSLLINHYYSETNKVKHSEKDIEFLFQLFCKFTENLQYGRSKPNQHRCLYLCIVKLRHYVALLCCRSIRIKKEKHIKEVL